MFNFEVILVASIVGFAFAVGLDLHAWKLNPGDFNWKLAAQRWVAGAIGGAIAVILAQAKAGGFDVPSTQNA